MPITSNASGIWQGDRTTVTVGASPFIFVNTENCPIIVFVAVGTVTMIEFSRDGIIFDLCGAVAGQVSLNPRDRLRVTYTTTPTMAYYPQ